MPECSCSEGQNPGVLLSSVTYANVQVLLSRALKRWKFPIVLSVQNNPNVPMSILCSYRSKIVQSMIPWVYPRADRLIAVSQGVATQTAKILSLPEHKIEVIYNPINIQDIDALKNQKPTHPWLVNKKRTVKLLI